MTPLPVLLLTGFLGSGKTSTLRYWLDHTVLPLKNIAVIINDFGEINVDAALLAQRQMELRSITGGCACCQSFDELVEQVEALTHNPDIQLVWIETSGLADPEEILDHLSAPSLQGRVEIRRVILVLDGTDFPCSWRGREVQAEQIRYADVILLNKTDRLAPERQTEIFAQLRAINPLAEIIPTSRGEIASERLSDSSATPRLHSAKPEPCGCDHEHHDHPHDDHDHPHEHKDFLHGASTLFFPLPGLTDRTAFEDFLTKLPQSVFRAKGFVRLTESPEQLHTFQHVRDQSELLLLPLPESENLTTGLVLIGPHLPEAELRATAAQLLLPITAG